MTDKQERVYLVATGETVDGRETYTRHDSLPPMCDFETLFSAPPAQPADIGNTISSKTPEPNEENPYVLWREIHRLRTEVQGPSGFATWQDAAVAERVRRVKAEQELRAALAAQPAEAQQEPVAWAVYKGDECLRVHEKREWAEDWARAEAHFGSVGPYHIRELFAAPPAQPDHQGHSCTHKCTWPQCEAAQPAPAQEPQPVSNTDELPQRLSDERIMHFWDIHAGMPTEKYPLNYKDVRAFARAIEAAIVPPGYVVVPVEPTQAMTEAVCPFPQHLAEQHPPEDMWHARMKAATMADQLAAASQYRAMIAAAPKASHDPR